MLRKLLIRFAVVFPVSPRAGRLVTEKLLSDLGAADFSAAQKAKEQYCQLLENPDVVNSRRKYSFSTRDGTTFTLTGQEYTAPEGLFRLSEPEKGDSLLLRVLTLFQLPSSGAFSTPKLFVPIPRAPDGAAAAAQPSL